VRPVIADFRCNRKIRRSVNSQFADKVSFRCGCTNVGFRASKNGPFWEGSTA
jgi:hypothetical protein